MGHLSTPRRILITGASGGIGEETARQLARAGHRVILAARREETLREVARAIASQGLSEPEVLRMDVTDPKSVSDAIQTALREPVDVLVNNAGICHQRLFMDASDASLRAEMELNYWGAVHTTRAILPAMIARREGTIVNVSSLLGTIASPTTASYSASKAALEAFTHALRGEVERAGVRMVVYVAPHTRTAMGLATQFDGVTSLPVAYTASGLVQAIDRRPREYTASPAYRVLLRMAGWMPGFMEKRVAGSVRRLLDEGSELRLAAPKTVP